ncbi:MAG: hypothetical protein V4447_10680 [Pseudomonadota bacterium]
MATVAESYDNQSQLSATLKQGLDTLSQNQTVTFLKYTRQALPLDGWIFWLNTGVSFIAKGSLHIATSIDQREDETIGISSVVFTAEEEIQDMSLASPEALYIAMVDGIQFSFKRRENLYFQAGLYHYRGDAVYPALKSQIVDNIGELDLAEVVVSNSLPIWLSLSTLMPIYPSFLIPQNIQPPYAAVHILPETTQAIQSTPSFDAQGTHSQLVKERVRIVIYGLRNTDALDFQDYVFQYSLNTDNIGIMNMPLIRDEKRTQAEMSVIAMKKSIDFEVNYYQSRLNDIARQYILTAVPQYIINPL